MLTLFKWQAFWYVRGTVHGQSVYASTNEKDKARARRFKDALEIRFARSAGQKCDTVTFREAASIYLEARPHATAQWVANIDRLCGIMAIVFSPTSAKRCSSTPRTRSIRTV